MYSSMRWSRSVLIVLSILALLMCGVIYLLLSRPQCEGFTSIPRIIWSYWHDPQIPPNVKKILDERSERVSNWEHRVLNETTVYTYIPKDAFPSGYSSLSHTHKADWIRLYLIYHYGGCWLDATIIINSPDELEELYRLTIEKNSDFTGYYNPPCLVNNNPRTWIESFFILAPIRSNLMERWFNEFTSAVKVGFSEYKKQLEGETLSKCYKDGDVYFTIYAALQNVLLDSDTIYIKDTMSSVYSYHYACNWDSKCVINKLTTIPKNKQPDTIKLIRADRDFL